MIIIVFSFPDYLLFPDSLWEKKSQPPLLTSSLIDRIFPKWCLAMIFFHAPLLHNDTPAVCKISIQLISPENKFPHQYANYYNEKGYPSLSEFIGNYTSTHWLGIQAGGTPQEGQGAVPRQARSRRVV
jgi:hypothetical protein